MLLVEGQGAHSEANMLSCCQINGKTDVSEKR